MHSAATPSSIIDVNATFNSLLAKNSNINAN
jgi:hypothetical protein